MPTLDFTKRLVRIALSGQKDKSGDKMHHHAERVLDRLLKRYPDAPLAQQHAALLHDIVEDTECTFRDLFMFGYNSEVVAMVELLTHDKDAMTYRTYVTRIKESGNEGALRIKMADNEDNSDPTRHVLLDPADSAFLLKRYAMARTILIPDGHIGA